MKALVTGISGFTGRYLQAELEAAGWEVVGLGHAQDGAAHAAIDLADADALGTFVEKTQPDAVIHLAAIAFVGHNDPAAFYDVNLVGTRNLLNAIANCSRTPSSVVLASSANIYGNTASGRLTESTPPNPANDYAVSKLAMEYMARLWMDKLPITIARPFNYTGVGQSESFLLPKIVSHFKRRAPVIELGNIDVWRDFSDVRAVAQAYRRLVETSPAGQTVNICSGEARSLRDALTLCSTISGHTLEVRVNPAFVRSNEVKSLCGSADALRAAIGSWNTPPLEDTLRWMLLAD